MKRKMYISSGGDLCLVKRNVNISLKPCPDKDNLCLDTTTHNLNATNSCVQHFSKGLLKLEFIIKAALNELLVHPSVYRKFLRIIISFSQGLNQSLKNRILVNVFTVTLKNHFPRLMNCKAKPTR